MEILDQIKHNIDFVTAETGRVEGSNDVKDQILNICNNISEKIISKTELKGKDDLLDLIKGDIKKFDELIGKIEGSVKDKMLFLLLITHVADIKFLFLTPEEQISLMKEMNLE